MSFDLVCEEHRGIGPGPCPWPGCPNGIPEDRFISFDPHLKDREYVRIEWPAYHEEVYYSWEDPEMGRWFPADSVLSCEVDRRNPTRLDNTIAYHYTDALGFKSIVESGELWLTDYAYLNDAKEFEHGLELAERVLGGTATEAVPESLRAAWLDHLRARNVPRMCMAAFSADGDSLSQWRAYGHIALGFDLRGDFGYCPGTVTNRVSYESEKQEDLIRFFFHHFAAALGADSRAGAKPDIAIGSTLGRLHQRLAFLKDPAFSDEREVRLVYIEFPDVMDSLGVPRALQRFRVSQGRIVSYTTTRDISPNRYPDKLPLRHVVVGPQPYGDVAARGIRAFLDASGYQDVTVETSRIPYRPEVRSGRLVS